LAYRITGVSHHWRIASLACRIIGVAHHWRIASSNSDCSECCNYPLHHTALHHTTALNFNSSSNSDCSGCCNYPLHHTALHHTTALNFNSIHITSPRRI
jgi:hypothetical protein